MNNKMQLMSEWLLEEKIDELQHKSNLESIEKMLLSLCQKELEVIKNLKIFGIDMTGTRQEVVDRMKNQEIRFFNEKEFEQILEKARKYDSIFEIVNS